MKYEIADQQTFFAGGRTRAAAARRDALGRLAAAVERHERALLEALHADLGKPVLEAWTSEIGFVLRDLRHAQRRVGRWMKGRRARVPWIARPGRAETQPDPLGVVLIVGPWNYPLQLMFSPLAAALAAGNCVCLKPSEYAPRTAEAVARLCADALPAGWLSVVQGGADTAAKLVAMPFDHILFTGSERIGRAVARAAAERLVPVTLELGGKSPCVVLADAPIDVAARRIMWGKVLNAGQTCVAPDYVLVEASAEADLLAALRRCAEDMVPERPPAALPPEYARIVNDAHFGRLRDLMQGATVYAGGEMDAEARCMAPAILTGVDWDSPVMQEEIFGPLLPVLPVASLNEAIARIAGRPHPLAAYLFTRSRQHIDTFRRGVAAGGICINDTLSHILPADLPFGGVGASGHGRYRGRAGFDTFSNLKAVMTRPLRPDPSLRYPPARVRLETMKRVYRWLMR